MDCTTIGASEPTRTPEILQVRLFLRWISAMGNSSLTRGKGAKPQRTPGYTEVKQSENWRGLGENRLRGAVPPTRGWSSLSRCKSPLRRKGRGRRKPPDRCAL